MSIKVSFACTHPALLLGDSVSTVPVCPECGERRIARTSDAQGRPLRAPTFRGACQGPSAIHLDLPAAPIAVAPSGPLVLKEKEPDHG